jgi:hypothetical protein
MMRSLLRVEYGKESNMLARAVTSWALAGGQDLNRSRKLTERATNAPQRTNARNSEAMILEMMSTTTWTNCTAVSRLIGAGARRVRASIA